MKLDQNVITPDGNEIPFENGPLTLRESLIFSMGGAPVGSTIDKAYKAYELYKRIYSAEDEIELSAEDKAVIEPYILGSNFYKKVQYAILDLIRA